VSTSYLARAGQLGDCPCAPAAPPPRCRPCANGDPVMRQRDMRGRGWRSVVDAGPPLDSRFRRFRRRGPLGVLRSGGVSVRPGERVRRPHERLDDAGLARIAWREEHDRCGRDQTPACHRVRLGPAGVDARV